MRRITLFSASTFIMVTLAVTACTSSDSDEEGATPPPRLDPGGTLEVPDVYTSVDGELHLKVVATPATSSIDGIEYSGMEIFDAEIVDGKGAFTEGTASSYIGPQWQVEPGDTVVVDYVNALEDTEFLPVGADEPELVPQPINLHTHGLTISPAGNSDNVLLSIPPQRSNRFVFDIPDDHHEGLYWYHPHIHGVTDAQVYSGLAGHIVVGRADGNYREFDGLPVVPMMIRYNVIEPGVDGELVDAAFNETTGTAIPPRGPMVYTVNGQVAPEIRLNPADPDTSTPPESAVWAFTNITGSASYVLALEEVDAADAKDPSVVGVPVDFTIVSVDGTPMERPVTLTGDAAANGYFLGQGGRVAVLVEGASDPAKVIRLIQVENRSGSGDASAYDWPAQSPTGGWRDYSREVLLVSVADPDHEGTHVDVPTSLTPASGRYADAINDMPVSHHRTFVYNEVAPATPEMPNNFPVDFGVFPDTRQDLPRVGTVEEWTILNYSSLVHPFHLHVQYGAVAEVVAPTDPSFVNPPGEMLPVQYVVDMNQAEPAPWTQDVVNIPPAAIGPDGMAILGLDGDPVAPGRIVLRVHFRDFLGTYVQHCHRLPHEDRGMMSLVRAIPEEPILVVAGDDGAVTIVPQGTLGERASTTVTPFGTADTAPEVATGDVDRDAIPDVAVATVVDGTTTVRVLSGASGYEDVVAEVKAFTDTRSDGSAPGASVALGDLNADGHDDIVVGQSDGEPRVQIYDGESGTRLADFVAENSGSTGGVDVATGMVEAGGRISLITGAGPGGPPTVNVYNFDLFGDVDGNFPDTRSSLEPLLVASFDGADEGDDGGLSIATGYPFAQQGGFATVLVSTRAGSGTLRMFSIAAEGHDHHEVGVTGVARPSDYTADAPRAATLLQTVDLGEDARLTQGAQVAVVATPSGGLVYAMPVVGGPVTVWQLNAMGQFVRSTTDMQATGSRIAGFG